MTATRNLWDISVPGQPRQMTELMDAYQSFLKIRDYRNALHCLEQAAQSEYIPGKLALARFLVDTPQLSIPTGARLARAEKLYRELLNLLELPVATEISATLELAALWEECNPIGYLGCLLRAKRLGHPLPDGDIETGLRRLIHLDIHSLGRDPESAYRLGTELCQSERFAPFAEIFLREACEAADPSLSGRAFWALARWYEANAEGFPYHRQEAVRCYHLAEQQGFSDILVRK